jgi:hypothetical protein
MLVLQVDEPEDEFGTWREGTVDGTEVYVAAIDQLVKEGLVDPAKVGITGYSRSGFYVARAITDSPDRFAAAAIANADPGSLIGYETYIDYATPTYAQNAANAFAGALPYGDGLKEWFERAPGFRTDRIHAPVFISAADPQHLISLWGIYAPLRDQGKPVELQYFRSGQHNLTKPLQIFAHQEMLVDWFDFWLNGHEDSDSTKSSQYARWRTLKKNACHFGECRSAMTMMRSHEARGKKLIFILVFLSHCALIFIVSRSNITQKPAASTLHEPSFVFFLDRGSETYPNRGLRTFTAANREKSRSADHSSRTP